MITITHPTSTSGTVTNSGLTFVDGKAEVPVFDDPAAVAVLTEHGYTFSGEPEKQQAAEDETPSKSWTKDRLTEWAAEHDVDLGEAKNKDDILTAIEAAAKDADQGAGDPADANQSGAPAA